MMFTMGRAEFPVDTHVLHIAKKLGWLPQDASREQAYEHLNRRVPNECKLDLHVLLVEHGKCCAKCAKNGKLQKKECAVEEAAAAAKQEEERGRWGTLAAGAARKERRQGLKAAKDGAKGGIDAMREAYLRQQKERTSAESVD